jgi:hypothetical protein
MSAARIRAKRISTRNLRSDALIEDGLPVIVKSLFSIPSRAAECWNPELDIAACPVVNLVC